MWCIEYVYDFSYASRESHIVAVGANIDELPNVLENIRKQYIVKWGCEHEYKMMRLDINIHDVFRIHDTDRFIVYDLPEHSMMTSIFTGSLQPHSIWKIGLTYDSYDDESSVNDEESITESIIGSSEEEELSSEESSEEDELSGDE